MPLTSEQLKAIFPRMPKGKEDGWTLALNAAMSKYEINTPRRIAAFLGQIGHESGQLRYDEELRSQWNSEGKDDPVGSKYEGRKNLGNYVAGDGARFIGRGVLQLTGRANYTSMSQKLQIDLVGHPERAKEPAISALIAGQYWKDRELNRYADLWNLEEITKRVNGKAMLGLEERKSISERALGILEGKNA